jgi:hypothetical protein
MIDLEAEVILLIILNNLNVLEVEKETNPPMYLLLLKNINNLGKVKHSKQNPCAYKESNVHRV